MTQAPSGGPSAVPNDNSDIGILAALAGLDESSNQSATQATINIIAVVTAYFAATLFAISTTDIVSRLPVAILLLVPMPVFLLQMLQMNWTSGVIQRTASLERIEEHLFLSTRLSDDYTQGLVGVKTTTRTTDIRYLRQSGWRSRILIIAGLLAYPGFWCMSIGYVAYVVYLGWGQVVARGAVPEDVSIMAVFVVLYLALVLLFVAAALAAFMPRKK